MRKFLSQIVAALLIMLIAAPAAMAQAERAKVALSPDKVVKMDRKAEYSGLDMPRVRTAGLEKSTQIKRTFSSDDARSYMNRKNASKFAPSFAAGSSSFHGVVIYQTGMSSIGIQMYEFSAQAPITAVQVSDWNISYGANYGAVKGADYFYVTDAAIQSGSAYVAGGKVYDPDTWELVKEVPISGDLSCLFYQAAYDPSTGDIYTCGYHADGSPNQFGIFDPETFTSSPVAELSTGFSAMSFSLDGTLYAMSTAGEFGTVNKQTAEFTAIKNVGLTSKYTTSGAIDYMAEKPVFYYATNNDDSADLYAIDCETGEYSLVYTFNNDQQIKGMYFDLPAAEPNSPGKPAISSVDFSGASLTGSVTFSAPAKLYGGDAAPAGQTLRYEIVANGKVVQSGSNIEYGHSYKIKVDIDASGLYKFNVLVYNEVGPSPKSNAVTVWIGPDAPSQPKNVKASWASDKMTVSWNAVTTGAHDGGLAGNVTYALYNAADSTLIKDALTATTYTFDLKEPAQYTEYQYYVVAICDGEESEPALSNVVGMGVHAAPFSTAINSTATPDWTIIDSNNDGKAWTMRSDDASISYHSTNNSNDWLITYPIIVKKGYLYTVSVSAQAGSSSYQEKMEVYAGAAPTVAGMTTEVIPPTVMKTSGVNWEYYTGSFLAETDVVYIGIHAISDKDKLRLSVNELSIDAGINGYSPAAATDLNVLVPYSGENKATLSYTTPTTTIAGSDLAGNFALTRVEVLVNDKIEYVDNKPTAGAMSSIEIDVPTFGVYDFKVIGYNTYGEGEAAAVSAYVGINKPGPATNAKVTEVSDGVVNITWDAVTKDIDGNVMNPALVTYDVYYPYYNALGDLEFDIIAEGLTDTFLNNVKAVKEGDQDFVQYIIYSVTEAGFCDAVTDMPAVGTPYDVPYSDTFANGELSHILAIAGDSPYLLTANIGLDSRNKDNGYIGFIDQYLDLGWLGTMWLGEGYTTLITGKIAITDKEPELSFYYAGVSASATNPITTMVACDGDTTVIDVVNTNNVLEWTRHAVDLSAYAGKTVQLLFKAEHTDYYAPISEGLALYALIDDIRLGDPIKIDLVAKNISAPSSIATEQQFKVEYTVLNQGTEEAKNVFVSLYANGNLVESSVDTLTVAAGQTITGVFDQEAYSLFESGTYAFSFVVDCEADQDLTNNTSDLVRVNVANSEYPTLQLSGSEDVDKEAGKATVSLEWDVPVIDVSSIDVVESFESESYPAFTVDNFGGWTLLNFNTTNTYGFQGIDFPNSTTAFGWILFDAAELGLVGEDGVENLLPYEGSCYMAAFAHQGGANNAWLISPNMAGLAQTVTFMARANTTDYGPETMECYISTTGKDVADFTQVTIQGGYSASAGVPAEWTQYSIDLPAGTQYFAIRSTATDTFILMVDNIQYRYSSPFVNLELVGYDVYRNQVKITNKPLTVEEYADVVTESGKYDYSVVAVYNEGNSAPSNVYTADIDLTPDGIADAVAGVKVAVEGNEIVVSGAEAVTISAVDGKLVYAGESGRVAVAAGVYVVKADSTVAKVIVK